MVKTMAPMRDEIHNREFLQVAKQLCPTFRCFTFTFTLYSPRTSVIRAFAMLLVFEIASKRGLHASTDDFPAALSPACDRRCPPIRTRKIFIRADARAPFHSLFFFLLPVCSCKTDATRLRPRHTSRQFPLQLKGGQSHC